MAIIMALMITLHLILSIIELSGGLILWLILSAAFAIGYVVIVLLWYGLSAGRKEFLIPCLVYSVSA